MVGSLDQPCHHLREGIAYPPPVMSELGVVAEAGPVEHGVGVRAVVKEVVVGPETGLDRVSGVVLLLCTLADGAEEAVAGLGQHLLEQVVFGCEVLVENGLGDSSLGGQGAHRGLVVAEAGKDPEGHAEKLLSPLRRW